MGLLIEISLIVGVIIFALMVFGSQISAKAGGRAKKLIVTIDKKYDKFIDKRLTLSILKKTDFDFDTEKIKEEVITLLKPDIEALTSQIVATKNTSGVKINYTSKYFQNLTSLAERYFRITDERGSQDLTVLEKDEFYKAINSGIDSDLTRRILDLKTRGF